MKRLLTVVTILVFVFVAAAAFADSSGSFTAKGSPMTCTATPATFSASTCTNSGQCISGLSCVSGLCTTGAACPAAGCPPGTYCNSSTNKCDGIGGFFGSTLNGGLNIPGQFTTNIQTPNGQGTTLLIRPSLDTGLFTETKLTTTINNATADVGIEVCVLVDPQLDNKGAPIEGTGLTVNPTQCVVYDQRIQQVSNTLFGNLTDCTSTITSTTCTTDNDCPLGDTCTAVSCSSTTPCPGTATCSSTNTTPGTCSSSFCQAPSPTCNFEILLTTLSAHSFDFVVPVGNGVHKVFMTWKMIGTQLSTTAGTTAACVGSAEVTVQQVKNFKNNSPISFTTN